MAGVQRGVFALIGLFKFHCKRSPEAAGRLLSCRGHDCERYGDISPIDELFIGRGAEILISDLTLRQLGTTGGHGSNSLNPAI